MSDEYDYELDTRAIARELYVERCNERRALGLSSTPWEKLDWERIAEKAVALIEPGVRATVEEVVAERLEEEDRGL